MEANTRKMPDCPVEITLQLIGDKWKVLIIRDLLTGTKRFNELMRSVTGITQKVLTSHLRAMEAAGLVNRTVYPEVPPRVEYSLTETGYSLKPILDSMVAWGDGYKRKSTDLSPTSPLTAVSTACKQKHNNRDTGVLKQVEGQHGEQHHGKQVRHPRRGGPCHGHDAVHAHAV